MMIGSKTNARFNTQQGFILVAVMVSLTLISAVGYMVNSKLAVRSSTDYSPDQFQTEKSRYVAEAGIQHARWALNMANCRLIEPQITGVLGEYTYEVTVFQDPSGSPALVNSRALLGVYEVSQLSDQLKVFSTVTTNAVELIPGADTILKLMQPDTNFGYDNTLKTDAMATELQRTLIKFDLSGLATDVRVSSAFMKINVERFIRGPDTVKVYRLTHDWVEGLDTPGASWNTYDGVNPWQIPGGDFDSHQYASFIVDAKGFISIDITELVNEWTSGVHPNYGMILSSDPIVDFTHRIDYSAGDVGNQNNRLRLILTTGPTCECGKTC